MIWNFDLTRSPCAVESRMSIMTFAGRCIDYGAGVLCVYMFILIWYFADSTYLDLRQKSSRLTLSELLLSRCLPSSRLGSNSLLLRKSEHNK